MENIQETNEKKINFADNWRYYLGIAKPYKWTFFAIIILILIRATLESGQNLVFKFIVDGAEQMTAGAITSEAFFSIALFWIGVFFVSVVAIAILRFFRVDILNKLDVAMMFDTKSDIFGHLVSLSHAFHSSNRTGSLISRLIRCGNGIESITDFITFHGLPLIAKVGVLFVMIAFFDLTSAIIILVIAAVFIIFSVILLRKQQKANIERIEVEDKEKGFISDVFMNIETVKHFGKEARLKSLFARTASVTRKKYLKFWDFYTYTESGHDLILGAGTALILGFTVLRFMKGELSVGTMVFIYTSYFSLITPLYEFIWGVRRVFEGMADLQEVVKYKKVESSVADKPNAKPMKVSRGAIEFNNVSFSYGKKREIIENFDLKIKPGEKVALVGHSGAGKTTLVKLLYRMYDVNKGEVLIDGKDVRTVQQESLRAEMSVVPQECVLFNDTIYSNVVFSKPSASHTEVMRALKVAKLYDFVMSLPEKEETIVGERGIKLSGGEKQRLSIARAVLADKKILVLDEATSSLDSKTEFAIRGSLEQLIKGRTTIIIAHRLSTVMNADKIVVLEKGKIMQVGKHSDLAEKGGLYNTLWKLQRSGMLKKG